jgi:hypothetical protein
LSTTGMGGMSDGEYTMISPNTSDTSIFAIIP